MKLSIKGLRLLKKLEGFRNHPYLDSSNIATIGFGFTYYPNNQRVTLNDPPITQQHATNILKEILNDFEENVIKQVKNLTQNQFDALVLFSYNVGIQAFNNSTLLKVIKKDPFNYEEIEFQFKRWNKSKGLILRSLTKRRNQENYIYQNGK